MVSAKLLRQKYANLEKTVYTVTNVSSVTSVPEQWHAHSGERRGHMMTARVDLLTVVTPQQSNYLFNNKRARVAGVVSSEIVLI